MDVLKMPHVTWEFILENKEDIKKLRDRNFTSDFIFELAEKTGLAPVEGPLTYQFENKEDPSANGITAFLILAESSITLHTWPEYNYGFVDIFSCKQFNINEAEKWLKKQFGPGKYRRDTVWRGKIIEEYYTDRDVLLDNLPLKNAVCKKELFTNSVNRVSEFKGVSEVNRVNRVNRVSRFNRVDSVNRVKMRKEKII